MGKHNLTLSTPPAFQCYDCQGCGECCRGRFAIIISQADRERIERQHWSDEELSLAGKSLFTPHDGGFQLAHHDDGSCIFLDDQGRCRIHARFGEPAKPLACRLYPFRLVPLGRQVRVDIRYDCPASSGNFGHTIPQYRAELLSMLHDVIPEHAATLPAPPLFGRAQPTWAQLCRISETFERLMREKTLDLTRRVLCCVNFSALLRSPRIITLEGRALSEFLEKVSNKVIETMRDDTLRRVAPSGLVRTTFRQLLGVYARIDQVGEKVHPWQRLSNSWRMVSGHGTLPPLRTNFPSVTFADIEHSTGIPTNGAAAVLERYLLMRLTSMSFFGRTFYQRSYLDGMNALLLTYPLICWVARAYALEKGLSAPDATCMSQALQIIDHQHGISPVLDFPPERFRMGFLTERSHLRALTIWYGS